MHAKAAAITHNTANNNTKTFHPQQRPFSQLQVAQEQASEFSIFSTFFAIIML